jgi:hypothetical protein
VERVALASGDGPGAGLEPELDGGGSTEGWIGESWTADGALVGVIDGWSVHLVYRLVVASDGTTRALDLTETAGGASLSLRADGRGRWRDAAGVDIAELKGCIDVDIATTPLTNTLPIRRLQLAPGASAEITVAYVAAPELTVRPAIQRYTRLDEATYRYESGTFAANVTVDEDQIVTDYAGIWQRIYPTSRG